MELNRACIFAHFDKHEKVDDYVYYYLNELQKIVEKIVFVTVSDISINEVNTLEELNIKVIKRENVGYDFYSYKIGIDTLDLDMYDELIICNDSVYGPIVPLEAVFLKMTNQQCDFWGITASKSIAYHVQSYFMVYRKNLLQSVEFLEFWKNVDILENKTDIVREYEVGSSVCFYKHYFVSKTYIENVNYELNKKDNFIRLLKRLLKSPYKIVNLLLYPNRYLSSLKLKHSNTSLVYWDKLLLENKMPFLKISLFTNHQDKKENFIKLQEISQSFLTYPISLIVNHLKRTL